MQNKSGKLFWTLAVLALLVVAARVALPHVLQWYVNRTLDSAEGYAGHVGDIDVALFRGAYVINEVEITKASGESFAPLFTADAVDISILMPALFRGSLVGELVLHQPVVNFVDERDPATDEESGQDADQTGAQADWRQIILDLFPVRFDRIEVIQGQIHFRSPGSEAAVDIYLRELNATVDNLTNSRELSETLVAELQATAIAMDSGELNVNLQADPFRDAPHFDLNARLLGLKIEALDEFIRAYTPVDIEAGTLDLVVEMAARDGQITGYLKPLLHNVEVFDWREDVTKEDDNILQIAWESLTDGIAELLENQPRDQIATRIPLEGDVSSPDTEVLTAIFNILRNAFINAFEARIEGRVNLSTSEPESESGPESQPQ